MAIVININPDDGAEIVDALVRTFDFTLPGKDQSLGRDVAVRIAAGIVERSRKGLDPDGREWAPNSDRPPRSYRQYKIERYEVYLPGELGGQMLSLLSLVGKPQITADSVEMRYGTDTRPGRSSRTGVDLRDDELKLTDTEKAQYFTKGGRNQPPRRFYEFDDAIAESVVELCAEAMDQHIKDAGF